MTSSTLRAPETKSYGALIGLILLIVGIGSVIGYVTGGGNDSPWYQGLNRPAIEPPGAAFGIVWPILYVLMSISAWRIWRLDASPQRSRALTLFGLQLVLNFIWSPLFFTLHQIALGAVCIAAMVATVIATVKAFKALDRVAAWLLAPYLAWISFAFILNLRFWMLNPQMSGL